MPGTRKCGSITTCIQSTQSGPYRFIRDLKDKCKSKPGNPGFWKVVQESDRQLSLISINEAKKQGGESNITENEAGDVSCKPSPDIATANDHAFSSFLHN